MSPPLLEVRDLRAWIASGQGAVRAVDGVCLTLNRGETFALVGESGCGKSMTALTLMRLLPEGGRIVAGEVMLEGRALRPLSEAQMREVRGGAMAMIFQEPASSLNPVLNVGTQLAEVLQRHVGLRGGPARRRAAELLAAVGIPDAERRLDDYPFQLSGGMKQRVMIAMALAGEPRLLIADEPTTALDVTIQAQVLELLARLQRERSMGMLLITHDLGIVSQMADRVAVMYAGEIVEEAPRDAFFAAPRHPYSRKLFAALPTARRRGASLETLAGSVPALTGEFVGCRFAGRCPDAWERCRIEAPGWTDMGGGQRVRCHLYGADGHAPQVRRAEQGEPTEGSVPAEGDAVLRVRDLRVHFPVRKGVLRRVVAQVRAVDGVSLDLAAGRTLALVGESGCGKTTVGKAVLRLIRASGGSVSFDGRDVGSLDRAGMQAVRRQLQMVFQDPFGSLNPRMRVGEIIREGMTALGVAGTENNRAERVAQLLESVGLAAGMRGRYPHEFSGGQRQRIAIARALAVSPRVVVCDEPTSALDVSVQAQILNLLRALQENLGLAYLFITHNLAVVDYMAHEVAVMYLGRIVERGPAVDILRAPQHPYTEALLKAVPQIDAERRRPVIMLKGDMPSAVAPPAGCHFHPRCPSAFDHCRSVYPQETVLGDGRVVRCHLHS
ncbi:MAG: ABC transporter ATP-binding protein [Betaproteobacteria bacterium]|nr:ABC transporter ATP-binding protein [Betaproteobacteria bacterium]